MKHPFFPQADVNKMLEEVVTKRGVQREVVLKLFEDVKKNIVAPLKTLNRNRESEHTTEALKHLDVLCSDLEKVLHSNAQSNPEDTPAPVVSKRMS